MVDALESHWSNRDRKAAIETAVAVLIESIGEDPRREGLVDTPKRVARMYVDELAIGNGRDLAAELSTTFAEDHHEMVVMTGIPFYSLCEHHMVPYLGHAHIGYIPDGKVVGLSKLARLVETASRRLTIQERLTSEIADAIERALKPSGVIVTMRATHLCMTMRGIQKPGVDTITSAVRGAFKENPATRAEFLQLVGS